MRNTLNSVRWRHTWMLGMGVYFLLTGPGLLREFSTTWGPWFLLQLVIMALGPPWGAIAATCVLYPLVMVLRKTEG